MKCIAELCETGKQSKVEKIMKIKKEGVALAGLSNVRKPYYEEDERYIRIYNFPAAAANEETKASVIYSYDCIKNAVEWYKNVIKNEQPFLAYMLDGHEDSQAFERVVGKVENIYFDENTLTVYIDFTIYKNSKVGKLISDILANGDPIGVSMVILHNNELKINRNEVKYYFENIKLLDDISENIPRLFGNNKVELIDDSECYIVRFDLTYIPSMYNTYSMFDKKLNSLENLKNKKLSTKDFVYRKKMEVAKEALSTLEIKKPSNIFINYLITRLINDDVNITKIDVPTAKDIAKKYNLYNEDFSKIFSFTASANYFNSLKNNPLKIADLVDLLYVFKEVYNTESLYSFTTLYDVVKLLTFAFIDENSQVIFENYKFKPDKDVKANRLQSFIKLYKQNLEYLKNEKNGLNFVQKLFEVIEKHINKYGAILTTYGAVIEALRLLFYILTNNIDIENQSNQYTTKTEALKIKKIKLKRNQI